MSEDMSSEDRTVGSGAPRFRRASADGDGAEAGVGAGAGAGVWAEVGVWVNVRAGVNAACSGPKKLAAGARWSRSRWSRWSRWSRAGSLRGAGLLHIEHLMKPTILSVNVQRRHVQVAVAPEAAAAEAGEGTPRSAASAPVWAPAFRADAEAEVECEADGDPLTPGGDPGPEAGSWPGAWGCEGCEGRGEAAAAVRERFDSRESPASLVS